jgi:ADP-ribose pyrophosphatase
MAPPPLAEAQKGPNQVEKENRAMNAPRTVFSTPWFEVKATGGEEEDAYYTFRSPDAVLILPITRDGRVIMVRQWRHARNKVSLELPAGGIDTGEPPEQAARRELLEETGYGLGSFTLVGQGGEALQREEGMLHVFLAEGIERIGQQEPGVEVVELDWDEFRATILSDGFEHLIAFSAILLAAWRGLLPQALAPS